jgi:membrane-bound metal-dependent hydrolase YbcI (DUF457 family)
MPSSIISHQAPGLYLKYKYPNKINGTAICLATFIPDLNIFFSYFTEFPLRGVTHSLIGIFIWTVPLTVLFAMLFSKKIAPFISRISKRNGFIAKSLRYFGLDNWEHLKNQRFNKKYFIVVIYSAIIGGLTHILLDLPSHEYIELFFPFILKNPDFLLISLIDPRIITIGPRQVQVGFYVYELIWFLETFILMFPSLYYLRAVNQGIGNRTKKVNSYAENRSF